MVNTVFGIVGVFDVATSAGLERHSADFGQTLGVWGLPSGPYLVLPLLGSSSARDTVGWTFDNYYNLWNTVEPIDARYAGTALKVVDYRTRYLGVDNSLNEIALDKYSFMRDAYLQRRSPDAWRRNRPADLQNSDGDGDDGTDGGYYPDESSPAALAPVAATAADNPAPDNSTPDNPAPVPQVLPGPVVVYQPEGMPDPALDQAQDLPTQVNTATPTAPENSE